MDKIVTLEELASRVPDGVCLDVGGVHLSRLPIALIKRVPDLGKKDFIFTSWRGGLGVVLRGQSGAKAEEVRQGKS